jgi:phosphopantothenoylcysteine decarboxylase/phosphopantothenate--cysteine ligase
MRIALGVSGGIAAYKAAEVLRLLQDRGIEVQVVMTAAAQEFVRPLTFAALSGRKVITSMFGERENEANLDSAVEHISVAQSAEALLVVPATADVLAKFAQGIANDFLSTLYLAIKKPVIVAPAMNVNMWEHEATQGNLNILRDRGVTIVEPGSGYLACGMIGAGRLADPEEIVSATLARLGVSQELRGQTVLVTAGPTQEPIDPVRYIGNRSSGKMGYAIAEAAIRRGAHVVLISGPTSLTPPHAADFYPVHTAAQMRDAVMLHAPDANVVIMTAAVADYRTKAVAENKIKREGELKLELEPTTDILAELGSRRLPGQVLIGFAAETDRVRENAKKKLAAKKVDAIVVNDVSRSGIGFASDRNAGAILTADTVIEIPEMTKFEMAGRILDDVAALLQRASKSEATKA